MEIKEKKIPGSRGLRKVEVNFFLILKKLEEVHPGMVYTSENKVSSILFSCYMYFLFPRTSHGPKWLFAISHYFSILANSKEKGVTKGTLP